MLDCYSDLAAAPNCKDPRKKDITDINDDGFCNQIDYNLFLRELSTQPDNNNQINPNSALDSHSINYLF